MSPIKARLKTNLSSNIPVDPLAKILGPDEPIYNDRLVSLLLKEKEIVVHEDTENFENISLEALVSEVNKKIRELISLHGKADLKCIRFFTREYYLHQKDLPEWQSITTRLHDSLLFAVRTASTLCGALAKISTELDLLVLQKTDSTLLCLLQLSLLNVLKELIQIKWVVTPISYALTAFEKIYVLCMEKDQTMDKQIKANALQKRCFELNPVFDDIFHFVHINNYKRLLPKIYRILLLGCPPASSTAAASGLSAVELSEDWNEDKQIIGPIMEYLVITVTFDTCAISTRSDSCYSLPNIFSCLQLKKYPTEFEFHIFKCLAFLGSWNSSGITEINRFIPYLINDEYYQYHSLFLKWLERILTNHNAGIWIHKKLSKILMNSRSFRHFKNFLTQKISQSSINANLNDDAKNIVSILSSITINFDTKDDLKETLTLVSFFKNDDFIILHFLVQNYLKLFNEIQKLTLEFVNEHPELANVSNEKKILAYVLQNIDLSYDKIRFQDINIVINTYLEDVDLLNQATSIEPQVHFFPQLSLLAKFASLLYWLASEDLECNDVIKDDIDDLTTPILTYCKFIIFDSQRQKHKLDDKNKDYDNWLGFNSSRTDDKDREHREECSLHSSSPLYSTTAFRMLQLIGKSDIISRRKSH